MLQDGNALKRVKMQADELSIADLGMEGMLIVLPRARQMHVKSNHVADQVMEGVPFVLLHVQPMHQKRKFIADQVMEGVLYAQKLVQLMPINSRVYVCLDMEA
jgi:hypothetical protein